jgi:alpha-mannosidase
MGTTTHPEATYLLFPFNVPNAQARFDIGGMPVRPHLDQFAGSCRDYFTVQGWVDFNNGEHGITIATPENPMAQLGDFHFAHNQQDITLERAMFLGWATNNYWETNFPGMQPGTVTARYVIRPYAGDFDESRAHRLASESEHSRPLVQHLGETAVGGGLPATGMLLHLPQLPILTLNMRADSNSVFLTLYNASDESQTAAIQSGLLSIVHAADCSLFGETQEPLEVKDGVVSVQVPRRSLKVIELKDVRLKFITQWS